MFLNIGICILLVVEHDSFHIQVFCVYCGSVRMYLYIVLWVCCGRVGPCSGGVELVWSARYHLPIGD